MFANSEYKASLLQNTITWLSCFAKGRSMSLHYRRLTLLDNKEIQECHIPGYHLAGSQHCPKHGLAMLVRQEFWNISSIVLNSSLPYTITMRISEFMIITIYKPPKVAWPHRLYRITATLQYGSDFNSHHMSWGYDGDRPCLLQKVSKIAHCRTPPRLLAVMLTNHKLCILLMEQKSRTFLLNNRLSQGSILTSSL